MWPWSFSNGVSAISIGTQGKPSSTALQTTDAPDVVSHSRCSALEVRPATIALGALLCCVLTACAGGKPPRTIGVSIQNIHSDFYGPLSDGIRSEGRALHYRLDVRGADGEAEQQSQIEGFISEGVDAIVIVPVDSNMIGGAVLEANAAEIPVFTTDVDSTSDDSNRVAYIASDNKKGGAKAAQLMCEGASNRGLVAIIDQPEVSSVRNRVQSFKDTLKAHCFGVKVTPEVDIDVGVRHRDTTKATLDLIRDHRDLAGIFFVNDESLLDAFPDLKLRKPCAPPILVGYDAIPPIQDEIDHGIVYGDAEQDPKQLGTRTIDEVRNYFNGKRFKNPFVTIDVGTYGPSGCAKKSRGHREPSET